MKILLTIIWIIAFVTCIILYVCLALHKEGPIRKMEDEYERKR